MPVIYPQNVTFFDPALTPAEYGYDVYNTFFDYIDGSFCKRLHQNQTRSLKCGVYSPPNVVSFSLGSPEPWFPAAWKKRQCMEYLKLGLHGTSVFFCSQDWGVGADPLTTPNGSLRSCTNEVGPRVFQPPFPASCP